MNEFETDHIAFINALNTIREGIDKDPSGYVFRVLFQISNNKLKIEIEKGDERQLVYVFYHHQQNFLSSMARVIDVVELRILFELIKKSFDEPELVRNAHITSKGNLYYFIRYEIEMSEVENV